MTLPAASRALCYAPWPIPESRDRTTYGTEIYDEHHRLCSDIVSDANSKFLKLLTTALNNAVGNDEINLHRAGLNETAAELINFSASDLKQGAKDLSNFERRIKVCPIVRTSLPPLSRQAALQTRLPR